MGKAQKLWTDEDSKIPVATAEYAKRFKEVCEKNAEVCKKLIVADMKQYEETLKRFEYVKDITLEFEIDDLLQGSSPPIAPSGTWRIWAISRNRTAPRRSM